MPKGVQVQVLLSAPTTYVDSAGSGGVSQALLRNILRNGRPKRRGRNQRVCRGLHRDRSYGMLWSVARWQGKVRWVNLKTKYRREAVRIMQRLVDLRSGPPR